MPNIVINSPNSDGSITLDLGARERVLSVNTTSSINIFKRATITHNPLVGNFFNLFQFVEADERGKFKYASFGTKKHIIGARRGGCQWNPSNGSLDFKGGEMSVCDYEIQEESCPDAVWKDCWKGILGRGLDQKDWYSTPEGVAMINILIEATFEGVGEGINELAWYANHPVITQADATGSYESTGISATDWEAYKAQMMAADCGGIMTIIDGLKADGVDNYNVSIGTISGTEYVDDPKALFERLLAKRTKAMRAIDKRSTTLDQRSTFYVTPSVFNKYLSDLETTYTNIPQGYHLMIKGSDNTCDDCATMPAIGVLMYRGHWVVCMDEWEELGDMTGTYIHRAILAVPKVFAVAGNANQLANQYSGMGMEIIQRLGSPWQGKVFMNAMFEMGFAIVDQDLVINASSDVVVV